jgi:SMODS-associated and fused to various effectors sensor domain
MSDPTIPTLTDRKGMGGVIALDGFAYQEWSAAAKVPQWLADPAFEAVGLEMLEDFEASFFVPDAPHGAVHRLERFQVKSATLAKAELAAVFNSFVGFSERHSGAVRTQTLITPALPSELRWLVRDGFRVANARPFYLHYPTVMDDSEASHAAKLVKEFGDQVGPHLVRDIAIDLAPNDEGYAQHTFATALEERLGLAWTSSAARRAFDTICGLLRARRGSKVGRNELYAALSEGNPQIERSNILKLDFMRGRTEAKPGHLGLDAEDGGRLEGSGAVAFSTNLQQALDNTAAWARGQGYGRIAIDAPLRLPAAFGLGAAFQRVRGFDLDLSVPGGIWSTGAHPPGSNATEWTIEPPAPLADGRLRIVIGVIRDPLDDVQQFLGGKAGVLHLHLARAVVSATDVQASVRTIKDAVSASVTRLKPDGVDLFFLGPWVMAAALGHRWNALPPTRFFDHDRMAGYQLAFETP